MIDYTKTFLFFFAHPDDESFYAGGTMARIAREGGSVHMVSLTAGEKGVKHMPAALLGQDLRSVRQSEYVEAARIVGATSAAVWDIPDGAIDRANEPELVGRVGAYVELYQPEYVVTFGNEPHYLHRDHQATRRIVQKAAAGRILLEATLPIENAAYLEQLRGSRAKTVDHYDEQDSAQHQEAASLFRVELSLKDKTKKYEALRAHVSQQPEMFVSVWQDMPKQDEYYHLRHPEKILGR